MEEGGSFRDFYLVLEAGVEGLGVCCIKKDYTSGRHYSILNPLVFFISKNCTKLGEFKKHRNLHNTHIDHTYSQHLYHIFDFNHPTKILPFWICLAPLASLRPLYPARCRFPPRSFGCLKLYFTTSIQSQIMPKYVPKEDVEKGLVDPTKPLAEQPQYKEKIEKQTEERQKKHEDKRPPQPVRPKKERPPRNARPKFNYNKEEITEQTKIPEAPKKLLEKPSKEKYYQSLDKLKAEREVLNAEKRALLDQQKNLIRDLTESKKTGRNAISQYSGVMRQKFNIENQLRKQIKGLNEVKERILAELQDLESRYNQLRKPSKSQSYSVEELRYRIDEKERLLTTGDINKNQEQKLNNEINELKRALQKARPDIEIESELGKLKDQIDILYKELKPIKSDLYHKVANAKALKAELDVLKEQKKSEEGAVSVQRTPEDIKKEFDEKIKAVQDKRDKLQDRIDDYMDKHIRENDAYEDQQDLLHYINWVTDQIQRLKKRKQDQIKRKKEKQEYEKRKLKEKEEYERRKEEKKKAEEQRKAREQQRKLKLQKEKQAFINRNPNYVQIDLCETLIGYCNNLRPSAKYQDKREKAPGEIVFGKEWQKQLKSGAVVIQSKKAAVEEEAPKKAVKPKKKQQKPEDEEFKHGMEVINQFQKLKLLPPNSIAEIDSSIKFLQEKLAIYGNPSEQEKAAFREKAIVEFEERNGLRESKGREYKQKDGEQEEKPEQKEKPKRKEKKELSEKDFPGLA